MKWLRRCIFGCALLALSIPLVETSVVAYSTSLVKALVFQTFVQVMFVAWVALAVRDARYRPNLRQPMTIAVIIFTVALLITLPFALDPFRSFFSSNGRMMGVFSYLHFIAWFFVLVHTHFTWREWRVLLHVANAF